MKNSIKADNKKLVNLKEIEGAVSPHSGQLDRALKLRLAAFEFLKDETALARFIGGKVESLGVKEDWALSKEIFPGVTVFFVYNRADEEFPASLKVLFSGERLGMLSGEDLVGMVISYVNHMLRFIREDNPDKKLPEVCYRV